MEHWEGRRRDSGFASPELGSNQGTQQTYWPCRGACEPMGGPKKGTRRHIPPWPTWGRPLLATTTSHSYLQCNFPIQVQGLGAACAFSGACSTALDTNEFQVHSVQRHLPVFQHAPMRWTPWGQGASACQNTRGLFFLSFLGSRGRLDASQEPNASGTRKIHSLKYVPACTGWEPASGTAGIVGGGVRNPHADAVAFEYLV